MCCVCCVVCLQSQTSGIESEALGSEFQGSTTTERSPPSQPPSSASSTVAADGSEQSGAAVEEREEASRVKGAVVEGEGEREKEEGRGEKPARADSGLGKEDWVAVQRKKKSTRVEGRVRKYFTFTLSYYFLHLVKARH